MRTWQKGKDYEQCLQKIIFSFQNSFVINTSKDFHYWWYCSWWRLSEYSAWERDYRLALRSFEDLSPTSCTIFSQNNLTNKSINQNILMLKANISCDRLCRDIQKTFDELSFILHSWSKESSKCTLCTSPTLYKVSISTVHPSDRLS